MNRITLIGRLGRDPEMKIFDSGSQKTSFSIAVRRNKDKTDWINIECWGKTAELAAEHLRKGNNVGIDGSLCIDSYEKNGNQVPKPFINCNSITLIDKKADIPQSDDELPF